MTLKAYTLLLFVYFVLNELKMYPLLEHIGKMLLGFKAVVSGFFLLLRANIFTIVFKHY